MLSFSLAKGDRDNERERSLDSETGSLHKIFETKIYSG